MKSVQGVPGNCMMKDKAASDSRTVLDIASKYHIEAIRHQQQGDHEKAAREVLLALNYYKLAE